MENNHLCRICNQNSVSPLSVKVPGSVRSLNKNIYTVWECSHCKTLNALELVDVNKIYLSYPIQNQKYDFFTKQIFKKRCKLLIDAGLKKHSTILDYGCGSGYFVTFLKDKGYLCDGYEPFNSKYSNQETLLKKYDFVVCQDVIEHVDNPSQFLESIRILVKEKGKLIVGMPFSDNVDLFNHIDQIGALHQPFHRYLIARNQINQFFANPHWNMEKVIEKCYFDTWMPFINSKFLFSFFKSGGGVMDIGFEKISIMHFFKNPSLIFWGFFGRFFVKKQDLFIITQKL